MWKVWLPRENAFLISHWENFLEAKARDDHSREQGGHGRRRKVCEQTLCSPSVGRWRLFSVGFFCRDSVVLPLCSLSFTRTCCVLQLEGMCLCIPISAGSPQRNLSSACWLASSSTTLSPRQASWLLVAWKVRLG